MNIVVARRLLFVWIGVILIAVVPWARFEDHSHWDEVDWLPFMGRPIPVRDVALNTLLYLPLGYLHRRQNGNLQLWRTVAVASGLSVATELTQVFSHGRFPSARDVTCNIAGAFLGAVVGRLAHRRKDRWVQFQAQPPQH